MPERVARPGHFAVARALGRCTAPIHHGCAFAAALATVTAHPRRPRPRPPAPGPPGRWRWPPRLRRGSPIWPARWTARCCVPIGSSPDQTLDPGCRVGLFRISRRCRQPVAWSLLPLPIWALRFSNEYFAPVTGGDSGCRRGSPRTRSRVRRRGSGLVLGEGRPGDSRACRRAPRRSPPAETAEAGNTGRIGGAGEPQHSTDGYRDRCRHQWHPAPASRVDVSPEPRPGSRTRSAHRFVARHDDDLWLWRGPGPAPVGQRRNPIGQSPQQGSSRRN